MEGAVTGLPWRMAFYAFSRCTVFGHAVVRIDPGSAGPLHPCVYAVCMSHRFSVSFFFDGQVGCSYEACASHFVTCLHVCVRMSARMSMLVSAHMPTYLPAHMPAHMPIHVHMCMLTHMSIHMPYK